MEVVTLLLMVVVMLVRHVRDTVSTMMKLFVARIISLPAAEMNSVLLVRLYGSFSFFRENNALA